MIPAAGASLATEPETGAAWLELAAMHEKSTPAANDSPTRCFIELLRSVQVSLLRVCSREGPQGSNPDFTIM